MVILKMRKKNMKFEKFKQLKNCDMSVFDICSERLHVGYSFRTENIEIWKYFFFQKFKASQEPLDQY